MKNLLFLFICFTIFSCKSKNETSGIQSNPTNEQQVVVDDTYNLFSIAERDLLTQKIIQFEKKTSNQIALMTIDSLPKNSTALEYATKVANKRGVGRADKDNGLLLLISLYDRQMAIATGNFTETILTDAICKQVIDSTIVPYFKNKHYYKGINAGLDSLIVKWH